MPIINRRIAYLLAVFLMLTGCTPGKKNNSEGTWIKLFNGLDLNDWIVKVHHHDVDVNFGNTFARKTE